MISDGSPSDVPPEGAEVRNNVQGSVGAVVQAGTLHGDVYVTSGASTQESVPRQLPMVASGFVNRAVEIARLDMLLPSSTDEVNEQPTTAVAISTIAGTPGIGKTALALHWAHRVRFRFADGDLYINMRGHGPGPRLDTSTALDSLLRTLGVPPDRIPLDLDGRAALYRSQLDQKRVLIVIDDAVSADQVRPLLPASPTCLVLITSRGMLSGLAAREGAQRVALNTLPTEESLSLLRSRLGAQRIDAEPEAAQTLVAHCAHLPLALSILVERLLGRPEATLSDFVVELAVEDERLNALGSAEDELSDIRAVFSASYTALPTDAANLFRKLGMHPGTEFSAIACALMVGLEPARTRPLLDQLTGANLLQRTGSDRYRLHDLLRVYAVERFQTEEPSGRGAEVLSLLAHWYLASARNAVRVVMPNFRVVAAPDGEPTAPAKPLTFDSQRAALAWFDQERTNLVHTARAARDHQLYDVAWRLPATVYPLFERHRHWHEWRELHLCGLTAARALGTRHGEARNLLGLADAEWLLGNTGQALEHYAAALEAAREVSDDWIEGFALRQIGSLRWDQNHADDAPALIRQGADAFRRAGELRGEGMALLSLAECERTTGQTDTALEHCHTAITIFTELHDTWSLAWARCFLAATLVSANRHTEAINEYQATLTVFRTVNDLDSEAVALIGTGKAYAALGETEQARTHLGAALDLLRSVDDHRADDIETAISRLP